MGTRRTTPSWNGSKAAEHGPAGWDWRASLSARGPHVDPGFAFVAPTPVTADIEENFADPYVFRRGWFDQDGNRRMDVPQASSTLREGEAAGELVLDVVDPSMVERVIIRRTGYVGRLIFDHLKGVGTQLDSLRQELDRKTQEIATLREQALLDRQRAFGVSSEKSTENPLGEQAANDASAKPEASRQMKPRRGNPNAGRKPLAEGAPEREERVTLEACERCGSDRLEEIGSDSSKTLVHVPESFYIRKTTMVKYVCRCCNHPTQAPAPRRTLERTSYGSPEFFAAVAVNKYYFGMPMYRQAIRLNVLGKPYGLKFNRTTLVKLMILGADAFTAVYEYLHQELLTQAALHADETVLQVIREPGKRAQSLSYLWGYRSTKDAARQVVIFEYQPSRAATHAVNFLRREDGSNYNGYVHTDGYAGYNKLEDATRIGCAAHVRRRFEIICRTVGQFDGAGGFAAQMLDMFRKLYAVEKDTKDLDPDARAAIRRDVCVPVFRQMYDWLDEMEPQALPKSALGRAIAYAREHLPAVERYLEDGRLALDNNIMERAIKMVVIGRKNWLFAYSQDGANANAVMYTLIQSAIANGVDPYRYLVTVLERLPKARSPDDFHRLMPWALRAEFDAVDEAEPLAA